MIIVVLLGIGAGASLFSTMGNARLDKRSGVNAMAKMLAQSSVEEVLIKITNNSSDFVETKRFLYTPFATKFLGLEQGFEVDQVAVLGRLIEKPSNPAVADEFLELMTAGPGFASPQTREAAYAEWGSAADATKDWREEGNLPEYMKAGQMNDLFHEMIIEMEGAGEEYHDSEWQSYQDRGQSGFQDGNAIRNAFWGLPRLSGKASGFEWDQSNLHTKCHFADCSKVADPESAGPSGPMRLFMDKWDEAMDAVGDRVSNRIAGCAGNPNYGVGAMISAVILGGASDADSNAEEEFRQGAQNGGLLDYQTYLVSVEGKVRTKSGGPISAEKAVVAHRLVARMNFKKAMDRMRDNLAPYLMLHYNLSPQDLVVLGWINPLVYEGSGTTTPTGPGDKLADIVVLKEILTKLAERYPDNPNPRVVPFQAATCVGKVRG
jgi:hypothetical protein